MLRPSLTGLLLLGLLGCTDDAKDKTPSTGEGEGEGEGEVTPEPVCARASGAGEVGVADANHDGRVDVSDGVFTLRYLMSGGPAPACLEAQDLLRDDLVDIGDALAIFYYLYTGQVVLPDGDRIDCEAPTAIADAPCGVLEMSLDAPATVSGAAGATVSAEVGVMLRSPDLDVQAWSFGVKAEGCTITGSREEGTAIADVRLDPEGRRDVGFTRSDVVTGGLTHGAVLSWKTDVVLAAQDERWRLLTLDLSATAPASGCATCTLALTGELAGAGPEVELVVSSGGRSYTPDRVGASVEVCAE